MELIKVELDNINGVLVTTSNRVAKELGVAHKDLLEKIDRYINKFTKTESSALVKEFYISSKYKTERNFKEYKNYLITKKGIAQLIGGYSAAVEKAFDLNVAYINKFEEMENELRSIKESKYKELENFQINSMKDFKFLYSSNECSLMLLSRITEEIQKIEKSLRMISSFKTHIYFYNNQINELLNKLQISLNRV